MKIHHVGYLVKDIGKSSDQFLNLGYVIEKDAVYDEYRDADISFLSGDGYRIELVSPHKTSDIYPLLKKYGNSPYHICYVTDDIVRSIDELKGKGYLAFTPIQPAPAIGEDAKVAFLSHIRMGMIELVEEN